MSDGRRWFCVVLLASIAFLGGEKQLAAQDATGRVDAALQNITSLVREGRIGYAIIWDGNKFVQCRRMPDRSMRCEGAGTVLQPSLKTSLTTERLARLDRQGWRVDPSFGNQVRTFPFDRPTDQIAGEILKALTDGYNVNVSDLQVATKWVIDLPCPPRNGPSQNLAGLISDAPSMRSTSIRECAFVPKEAAPDIASNRDELIKTYGARASAEIQRLRVNIDQRVWIIFDAGIGYVQCMPDQRSNALYCEAQSAQSWSALNSVLTTERIAQLIAIGYAEPDRAPNYWKRYPLSLTDSAIAHEILTVLSTVYGYRGTPALKRMLNVLPG